MTKILLVGKPSENDPNENFLGYLLKVLPNVDGPTRVMEPVRLFLKDVDVLGAWEGPAALLELRPHALAPVADLPVRKMVGARHFIANLTLDVGEVVLDYLATAPHA